MRNDLHWLIAGNYRINAATLLYKTKKKIEKKMAMLQMSGKILRANLHNIRRVDKSVAQLR